ncbi:hypothetical protein L484_014873 [Morus notabilis]|uniref:Uncharacterized protein n=1 Tax=Morus notabilis TaxID=981085 RepID=W9SCM7_9ROSA|nr:hypothetical protein L484_014873 [Morus notabilis]
MGRSRPPEKTDFGSDARARPPEFFGRPPEPEKAYGRAAGLVLVARARSGSLSPPEKPEYYIILNIVSHTHVNN